MVLFRVEDLPLLDLLGWPDWVHVLDDVLSIQLLDGASFLFGMGCLLDFLLILPLDFLWLFLALLALVQVILFVLIIFPPSPCDSLIPWAVLERIIRTVKVPFGTSPFGLIRLCIRVIFMKLDHVLVYRFASGAFGAHYYK